MSFLVKLGLFAALLWAGSVALFTLMQGSILFPRAMVGPAPQLPPDSRALTLVRPDGVELHGVLIPGGDPALPLLLVFGGNAWNAEAAALFVHRALPDYPVAGFHYRGYAPSTGRPSSKALMSDAEAVHDLLATDGMDRQIAIGFSIGSGVAAHLAANRPVTGAVLVTPFDSLTAVARQTLPWAPVRFLFRHEMDASTALQTAEAPVALILAERDEVIPPARAEALVTALSDAGQPPAFLRRINAGHNDIYGHPDFARALREAVAGLSD